MMVSQFEQRFGVAPGSALSLMARGGELRVLEGTVWLTRRGDESDHVLHQGQRILLTGVEDAVIESLPPGQVATIGWRPEASVLPIRALARVLRSAAGALATLARGVASVASRAEGRIASDCSVS